MHSCGAVSLQSCCSLVVIVYSHTLTPGTCVAQVTKHIVCVSPQNTHTSSLSRNVTLQNRTPRTDTPSSPFPESVFQRPEQRPQQSGALTELPLFTGYGPNQLAEDRDYRHFTRDGQSTEKRIYVSVPWPSTSRSKRQPMAQRKGSRRTQNRTLDDEQLRTLLASAAPTGATSKYRTIASYHSERENLVSSSSQDPISTGKPVALFSSQNRLNQDTFFRQRGICLKTSTVFWEK